ncbi:MAG: ATP-dependent Clp protease ATP-binding subunit ClpX, partial [Clostridia bacterium]|nr:ATP-dependent Clp protease ATP-binding subunit ClpX [Clostridia bacterium]
MEAKRKCMLCGRVLYEDVDFIIPGAEPDAGICYDCVATCVNLIKKESLNLNIKEKEESSNDLKLLKPREIKAKLDEYIIG